MWHFQLLHTPSNYPLNLSENKEDVPKKQQHLGLLEALSDLNLLQGQETSQTRWSHIIANRSNLMWARLKTYTHKRSAITDKMKFSKNHHSSIQQQKWEDNYHISSLNTHNTGSSAQCKLSKNILLRLMYVLQSLYATEEKYGYGGFGGIY